MEFLNPWYMVWGGALVSSPIIIHLINRMRFKRIRWAAMEFLLKSQKRNRRRLIIEQMILLLLRILLVLLAGFLVARLVNKAAGKPEEGSTHVIVLDDSLSLADHGFEKNGDRTGFTTAKDQVLELAKTLNKATSPQRLQVKLLSDLEHDLFPVQTISDEKLAALEKALNQARTTYLRLSPEAAFETGLDELAKVSKGQKVFHFASDFRDHDWTEAVQKQVDQMVKDGVHVSLIDAAGPYRNKDQKLVQNHENYAILDVKCETSVVPVGVDAEFTVTIKNYGLGKVEPFLTVKVDGVEDYRGIGPVGAIPGGQTINKKFQLSFGKKKPTAKISSKDPLEERERKRRQDRDYYRISVQLNREPGETGIRPDNARDMVIEVREEIPLLVVEGRPSESREDGSDVAHLESAIESARAYFKVGEAFAVQRCKVQDLDHVDLSLYPTVFFLNVAEVKSKKALDRLDEYVRGGGSIAYFMGENVQPDFYNNTLYGEYDKLFPVLLDRVSSLIDPSGTLTPEERELKREEQLQKDQPKILFRDGSHAVVRTLYPERGIFGQLDIDRYYRAQPRSRWNEEGSGVDEIITLPNNRDKKQAGYGTTAQDLGRKAVTEAQKLAKTDPEFKTHAEYLVDYQRKIATAASAEDNYEMVSVFDALLNDQGIKGNDKRPDLTTLWAHPRMKGLQQQIKDFIETVSYGDPLVVARRHGASGRGGRVVAILTTAGTASHWNRWGGGSLASYTFVPFIIDLERWLLSGGRHNNRTVVRPRYQLTSESFAFLRGERVPETVIEKLDTFKNKVHDRDSFKKAVEKVLDKDEQGRFLSLIMNLALSKQFKLELEAGRYQQKLKWAFQPQDDMDQLDEHKKPRRQSPTTPTEETMQLTKSALIFPLPVRDQPGILTLELLPLGVAGQQVVPETRAYAFNVDTRESEMKRASRDTLLKSAGGKMNDKAPVVVRSPEDSFETYKEKEPDVSESAWLYLLFLVILVVEQAMAVHLSFHQKENEVAASTPAPRPAGGTASAA